MFLAPILGSVVRHALTGVGAYLVAKGFVDNKAVGALSSVSDDYIFGVVSYALGQGWSLFNARKK